MAGNSLQKLDPREFDEQKARHLLNRAGFGGTAQQASTLANAGLDKAVAYIVDYQNLADPEPVEEDAFDSNIMRPRTQSERETFSKARRSGDESALEKFRKERQQKQRLDRQQVSEMELWWLNRLVSSPRPLEEKMTLFWHGHFATGYRSIENSYHMYKQNMFFRNNALGNFKEDLVRGIIHDPAMIKYLNNDRNQKQAPNENLARELMELFTLGEGEGYDEDDIKEGARALTGYTIQDDSFAFQARQHDTGTKTIFGRRGQFDGDDFVDLIFNRPSVSTFIIWKLYRFFVNDLPHGETQESAQYVKALSSVLKRTKWEIKPVIEAILLSEHFYAEHNLNAIIKSPIQLVVQSVRSLTPPQRNKMTRTLAIASDLMGQRLFAPPSVKGWDGGRSWINTSTIFYAPQHLVVCTHGSKTGWFSVGRRQCRVQSNAACRGAHSRSQSSGSVSP